MASHIWRKLLIRESSWKKRKMLKAIGSQARMNMERFLGIKNYLELL